MRSSRDCDGSGLRCKSKVHQAKRQKCNADECSDSPRCEARAKVMPGLMVRCNAHNRSPFIRAGDSRPLRLSIPRDGSTTRAVHRRRAYFDRIHGWLARCARLLERCGLYERRPRVKPNPSNMKERRGAPTDGSGGSATARLRVGPGTYWATGPRCTARHDRSHRARALDNSSTRDSWPELPQHQRHTR